MASIRKKPNISVIVPVYNVEKYLNGCLDSLVNQSAEGIEIIAVNDGSTDDSPNILAEYENKYHNIRVFHQKNAGLSAARNSGIEYSSGRFLGFLDSDDFADHEAYKTLLNVAENKNADIVKSSILIFKDRTTSIIDLRQRPELNILSDTPYASLQKFFRGDMNKVVWDGIYRRELFSDLKFPVGRKYEDHYYTPNALLRCKKYFQVSDILFYYRKRKGAITDIGDTKGKVDKLQSLNEIYRIIQKMDSPERICSQFSEYLLKMCNEYHNSLIYIAPFELIRSRYTVDNLIESEVFQFALNSETVTEDIKNKIRLIRKSHMLFFTNQKIKSLINALVKNREQENTKNSAKPENSCSKEIKHHITKYLNMYA